MAEKDTQTKVVSRKEKKTTKVNVTIPMLNVRKGPGFEHESTGFARIGIHEVTEKKGGFGRLEDGSGWIFLACTEPVKEEKHEPETETEE